MTLDGCEICDHHYDGVIVRNKLTKVLIRDCDIQRSGRRGISCSDGAQLLLSGSRVDYSGGSGVSAVGEGTSMSLQGHGFSGFSQSPYTES